MSLDLAVLPLVNAGSFEQALAIYAGDAPAALDDDARLFAAQRSAYLHLV